jgi:hypothetical protein
MPAEIPPFGSYREALEQHGGLPIMIETTISRVIPIVAALQLAMRHPAFPPGVHAQARDFIDGLRKAIHDVSPLLANVIEAGDDRRFDVRPGPAGPQILRPASPAADQAEAERPPSALRHLGAPAQIRRGVLPVPPAGEKAE